MAGEATAVYLRHPYLYDKEMDALASESTQALYAHHVQRTVTADDSKRLNEVEGPCAIVAGSGMCTGGRILHHFKQNLWKPDTQILIVGFQAQGSLGRQLVNKASHVTIQGERIAVRAAIHTLGGFSAHAGQTELLKWLGALAPVRPRVALTHGEDAARGALGARIREKYGLAVHMPNLGESLEV
jgi:metallo-beta-lactamase family protein